MNHSSLNNRQVSKRGQSFEARLAAALLAAICVFSAAGCQGSEGYYLEDVRGLAIDPAAPETVYAGTRGGMFKSTDGGESWRATNAGLAKIDIQNLAIDPGPPGRLYAGTNGEVFESTDGGESWASGGLAEALINPIAHSLAVDLHRPHRLYAGTNYGLQKFPAEGEKSIYTILDDEVEAVAIDPLAAGHLYAGTAGGKVARTTDGGENWEKTKVSQDGITALAADPHNPGTIYAGTTLLSFVGKIGQSEGVFKSTDGGRSWRAANTGLGGQSVGALAIDPLTPDTLYAGTHGGLFKSTDGGNNWLVTGSGLDGKNVQCLAIHPSTPSTLYAGTDSGLFKSTDGGATWTAIHRGPY